MTVKATTQIGMSNMTKLSSKVALSVLAVAAMLSSPAFAKAHHQVGQDNGAAVYSAPGNDIPAYDADGGVVGIANPDQAQR
jgi:hypothetical protein